MVAQRWRDTSLRNKILTIFSLPMLLLIGIGAWSWLNGQTVAEDLRRAKAEGLRYTLLASTMEKHVIQVQQWLTDISATRAQDGLDDGFAEAESHYQAFLEGLAEFKDLYQRNGREVQALNDLQARFSDYYAMGKRMAKAYIDGGAPAGNRLMANFDAAAESLGESLQPFIEEESGKAGRLLDGVVEHTQKLATIAVLSIVLAVLVLVVLAWWLANSLSAPLKRLAETVQSVEQKGDLTLRVGMSGRDEVGRTMGAFDSLMSSLQDAVRHIDQVMGAVAAGDFERRVDVPLRGDLNHLKDSVNDSAESVQRTMNALSGIMGALYNGDFSQRMGEEVRGDFRHEVNESMEMLENAFADINTVMNSMTQGHLSDRVSRPLRGQLKNLADSINTSMAAVERVFNELSGVQRAMADGDLSTRSRTDYPGIYGELAGSVHQSVERLRSVVEQVQSASQTISQSAQSLRAGNQHLKQRSEEQASALDATASSMEEITGTVKHNAENSAHASELAHEARSEAEKGTGVMHEADDAMRAIVSSSEKISDIIGLIDEIAFQTNLLALNASVEAARAGEQGRGFAVVATEVRSLAQRSATAAQEIKVLIGDSLGKISNGSRLVQHSASSLEEIMHGVEKLSEVIGEIATASQEQASGIDQVNRSVTSMDQGTQQNAQLAREAETASAAMEEQSETLSKLVGFFRL